MATIRCDVLILGGGTGGCAAAQALAVSGLRVVMTEPTDWIGGQFTSQMVPSDEHPWIERFGSSERFRAFRRAMRDHYRMHENLTLPARRKLYLNPGNGWVSRICVDPRVAHRVLEESLGATRATGRLQVLLNTDPIAAQVDGDRVVGVTVRDHQTGDETEILPTYILEATEVGDLYPLAGIEYKIGAESRTETDEPHALEGEADPGRIQSFTWVFAMSFGGDPHTVAEPPADYEKWRHFAPPEWPYPQIGWNYYDRRHKTTRPFGIEGEWSQNLFTYRQCTDPEHFTDGRSAATLVNWPQNDFQAGAIVEVTEEERQARMHDARQLSLSLFHWLRTEAPRPDGGVGYPDLRLAPEISGTPDGLAKAPYHREGRRLKARFTMREQDVSEACNPGRDRAVEYPDAVGIGCYAIDLHPAANGEMGLEARALPFQIPLGALLPERVTNVIAAGKGIGVTHITNGCTRLHPVEWVIGEAAGLLAGYCLKEDKTPHQIYESAEETRAFQQFLESEGVETQWPTLRAMW